MTSRLLRPFGVDPTPLATLVSSLGVGIASAAAELRFAGVSLGAPRVALVAAGFAAAVAALVLAGSGLLWGSRARATHARIGIVSALLLTAESLDALHFAAFRHHVDAAALHLAAEAYRTGTAHLRGTDALFVAVATAFLALLLALAHAALSRVPSRAGSERRLRSSAGAVVFAGLLAALGRDRLVDQRHEVAARFAAALPWAGNPTAPLATGVTGLGSSDDDRTFSGLAALRARLVGAPLAAKQRPNLLVVHVESLRSDAVTKELMPRLSALSTECWSARRHYTTGNNTGMSVFGLVTGLGGFYYADARREPAPALPLVVLSQLGYRTAAHLANDLAEYDGIFDVVFRGGVDAAFTAPKGRSTETDVAAIEHYLAAVERETDRPRFDYLVLDSTHYDYAYPPEYAHHAPAAEAALGVKQALTIQNGINDVSRALAPLYKNRYLNSVEWMDALLGRLVDGLQSRGKWAETWVAIVGDHGEAFWEHGTMGHGGGLEEQEIRVPLVLCGGVRPSSRHEYTSHADLMPTWFDAMGVTGVPGPFMTGRSLTAYRPEADVAVAGMGVTGVHFTRRFVAMGEGLKVEFENSPGLPLFSVSDAEDRPLAAVPDAAYSVLAKALGAKRLRSPTLE